MYICDECNEVFEEPIEIKEDMNGDGWAIQTYSVSPCCNASYTEAHECEACGVNYVAGMQRFCKECETEVNKSLNALVDELIEQGMEVTAIYRMIANWADVGW